MPARLPSRKQVSRQIAAAIRKLHRAGSPPMNVYQDTSPPSPAAIYRIVVD